MSLFVRNEDLKTYIRRYPITSLFLTANVVVFILMTISGGSTKTNILLKFGAYYQEGVLQGEWYRFVAPLFIHIGLEHLLFNCFAILIFAPGLEIILGSFRYLLLYLATGIIGFVITFFFSGPQVLAAGASGAIFGIYGLYAYLMRHRRELLDWSSRQTITPIIIFGLISTFAIPGISIYGHLGGLVLGYLLGFLLLRKS
ncbi:MAG TPA: rhomboid family intramembrane serine protease [Bacillota bacterium]|nr:rhomboid family intramembrane serine protease [Bacillota bacterium]